MQSEAVGLAYRTWRREWRGKGKQYVSGYACFALTPAQLTMRIDCRCPGMATERLLACHILVNHRLLPTKEAGLLRNEESSGSRGRGGQARTF